MLYICQQERLYLQINNQTINLQVYCPFTVKQNYRHPTRTKPLKYHFDPQLLTIIIIIEIINIYIDTVLTHHQH